MSTDRALLQHTDIYLSLLQDNPGKPEPGCQQTGLYCSIPTYTLFTGRVSFLPPKVSEHWRRLQTDFGTWQMCSVDRCLQTAAVTVACWQFIDWLIAMNEAPSLCRHQLLQFFIRGMHNPFSSFVLLFGWKEEQLAL